MSAKLSTSPIKVKSQLFQYVTSTTQAFKLGLLAASIALTGCSSGSETADRMDNPPTGNNPKKPTPVSNRRFAPDSFGALINVALLNIERATEIALKEDKATHIEKNEKSTSVCQTVNSSVSGLVKTVSLTTNATCAKTRSKGFENFQLTSKDGGMSALNTTSNFLELRSGSTNQDYEIQQNIQLVASTRSASPQAFDFMSSTTVGIEIQDSATKTRRANFIIAIRGTAIIAKDSGLMTAVSIQEARVDMNREDKTGSTRTISTISLTPEDDEFVAITCGRYDGRLNFNQTIETTNTRLRNALSGALMFSPTSVEFAGDNETLSTPVAPCAPGFLTNESDLVNSGNKVLIQLRAQRAEQTRVEEPLSTDEE